MGYCVGVEVGQLVGEAVAAAFVGAAVVVSPFVSVGAELGVAVGAGVGAGARAKSTLVVDDAPSPPPDVTTNCTSVVDPIDRVPLLHALPDVYDAPSIVIVAVSDSDTAAMVADVTSCASSHAVPTHD